MSLLPEGFGALEPFVADWAKPSAAERDAARTHSEAKARQTFYDSAKGLLETALDYLDETPLAEHDAAQQRLMQLILSFAHVSLAVEVQGADEARHAQSRQLMHITRATADYQ